MRILIGIAIGLVIGYVGYGIVNDSRVQGRCAGIGGEWNEDLNICEGEDGDTDNVIDEEMNDDEDEEQEVGEVVGELSRSGEGSELVEVANVEPGTVISSPLTLTGEAPGYWFFEATAPVTITNWDGLIIGEGFITAEGEWMTEEQVPFSGTIEFDVDLQAARSNGFLILNNANASGLPENDAHVEIPINFEA